MLIAVDGSSSTTPGPTALEYEAIYRNSFVRELYETTLHQHKQYFHGPNLLSMGREVVTVSGNVVSYISDIVRSTDDRTIVMAGHSRGGAACIHAAMRMQRESWSSQLTIQCMALFDAIDRDLATDTQIIPDNVLYVYHAMRNPLSRSRPLFGNTGTSVQQLTIPQRQMFMTTHSGVGGVPLERLRGLRDFLADDTILTPEQEIAGMQQVKAWMWRRIRRPFRIYEPVDPSEVRRTDSRPQTRWRAISQRVTDSAEVSRVHTVFDEIEQFRQQVTLPEARTLRGIPTIARLDIPRQRPFYGVSRSSLAPSGISSEQVVLIQQLLKELYEIPAHRVVLEHAEADAIITAWNRNIFSPTGILYTDRPLCGFCAASLRRLIPLVQMQQLTVYQLQPETGHIYRALIQAEEVLD